MSTGGKKGRGGGVRREGEDGRRGGGEGVGEPACRKEGKVEVDKEEQVEVEMKVNGRLNKEEKKICGWE